MAFKTYEELEVELIKMMGFCHTRSLPYTFRIETTYDGWSLTFTAQHENNF